MYKRDADGMRKALEKPWKCQIPYIQIERICPKCGNQLMINIHTARVVCFKCKYIEPCHLNGKIPSERECSRCPYSPFFKIPEKSIDTLKRLIQKSKSKPIGRMKSLTPEEIKNILEFSIKALHPSLKYPKLIKKCSQAWNPQEIRSLLAKNN